MTLREFLYALLETLQGLLDRIGLAWMRAVQALIEGHSGQMVGLDLAIVAVCITLLVWILTSGNRSRR